MTLAEIKDAIRVLPRRADGKLITIPMDLRREIVSQAKVSGDKRIGDEIGIHPVTIYGWRRRQRVRVKRPRFQRVAIAAPEVSEPRLVVEGPRGLKFLGLTISDAAKLVREVAHEF